jgi:nucleoid DNA-binding protein
LSWKRSSRPKLTENASLQRKVKDRIRGLTVRQIGTVMDVMIAQIITDLANGKEVRIGRLGRLMQQHHKAFTAWSAMAGKEVYHPPRRVIFFKAASYLKGLMLEVDSGEEAPAEEAPVVETPNPDALTFAATPEAEPPAEPAPAAPADSDPGSTPPDQAPAPPSL